MRNERRPSFVGRDAHMVCLESLPFVQHFESAWVVWGPVVGNNGKARELDDGEHNLRCFVNMMQAVSIVDAARMVDVADGFGIPGWDQIWEGCLCYAAKQMASLVYS